MTLRFKAAKYAKLWLGSPVHNVLSSNRIKGIGDERSANLRRGHDRAIRAGSILAPHAADVSRHSGKRNVYRQLS